MRSVGEPAPSTAADAALQHHRARRNFRVTWNVRTVHVRLVKGNDAWQGTHARRGV